MKNMKRLRIIGLSFLFLTIQILPTKNPFLLTAQSQSTLPNLEDTEWKVTIFDFYASSLELIPVEVIYGFRKQGKVGLMAAIQYQPPLEVSADGSLYFVPPTLNRVSIPNGTYKQAGNSLRLEFSDHIINATIKGNRMEGEATSKVSNKKAKWAAEKNSKEIPKPTEPITKADRKKKAKDAYRSYEEGNRLLAQEKYNEAIAKYNEAMKPSQNSEKQRNCQ